MYMKKNILISGASGLIGTHLSRMLTEKGHEPAHLVRPGASKEKYRSFHWSPDEGKIDPEAISWADAIINLSGAAVADKHWTDERKKLLISSRVNGLNLLAASMKSTSQKPKVLVSASGIGIYGIVTNDHVYTENDPSAQDFFGECCRLWEEAADRSAEAGLRVVKLRIGVVLAREGGALPKLAGPVKWLVGSPLGSGKQWMPWIHIDDLAQIFLRAIEDGSMSGVYNAVTAEQVTNKAFIKAVGRALGKPVFMPAVPSFALKLVLGEMAGIVTEGSRVSCEKLLATGFKFHFEKLEEALADLL